MPSRMVRRPARTLPLYAAIALLTLAAASGAILERVTSELVLIEVYVTDAKGRPVPGLTPQDFVLQVSAHDKPIASLEYRETMPPPAVGPTTPGSPAPMAPAGPPPTAGADEAASGWPRRFVLFFEDGTSAPQGLTNARRASDRFLATGLAASDQVAVAAFDRRLKILHDFSTDRAAIQKAIEQSLGDPMRLSDFAAEEMAHRAEIAGAAAIGHHEASALASNRCFDELSRLRPVVRALRSLIDSLAPWRGYKAIVFMGEGVPENPMGDVFDTLLRSYGPDAAAGAGRCTLTQEVKDLNHAAAAAGVTIHTIQTAGLTAGGARGTKRTWRRSNALETLAMNTGGVMSSSNDLFAALRGAEEASRSYYVIGYQPEGPPDGQYHPVVVRCRRRGLRLRWRHGFTRLPPAEARARAVQAAHLLPELYADLGVDLIAVAGPRLSTVRVTDLVVHLPADRILFLPEDGQPTAHIEVGLVAIDASLRETVRIARRLKIALPPDLGAAGAPALDLYSRVRLPLGTQTVTAVVSDETGGAVGGGRVVLPAETREVHEAGGEPGGVAAEILGLSLYSLSAPGLWIEIPADPSDPSSPAGARTEAGAPEQAVEISIGPALKSIFAPGEAIACGFRLEGAASPAGRASFRLEIRSGDRVVRSRAVAVGPGGETAKIPLPADGLASGNYLLIVQEDLPAGAVERARTSFRVR